MTAGQTNERDDTMTGWLSFVRAAWLAGIPCNELMEPCRGSAFKDLALHEYARLGWAEWRKK